MCQMFLKDLKGSLAQVFDIANNLMSEKIVFGMFSIGFF